MSGQRSGIGPSHWEVEIEFLNYSMTMSPRSPAKVVEDIPLKATLTQVNILAVFDTVIVTSLDCPRLLESLTSRDLTFLTFINDTLHPLRTISPACHCDVTSQNKKNYWIVCEVLLNLLHHLLRPIQLETWGVIFTKPLTFGENFYGDGPLPSCRWKFKLAITGIQSTLFNITAETW